MLKAYPDHKIVLCIGHFGKYELLKAIAKELKEKIQVTSNFLMIAKRMAISNIFTLQDARITTKETEFLSEKDLHKLKSKIGPTIVLIFSPFFNTTADHENIAKFQEMGLNILPYSEHSNHKELYTFIEALRPNAIVPIIKPNAGLDPAVIRNSTIPTCIAALQRSGGIPMSLVSEMMEKCAVNGSILEEGGEPKRKRKKISPSSVAKSCSSAGKCTVNTRNLELGSPALETGYDINKKHLTKSCSITRKRTVHTRNLELGPPALGTGYDINKKDLTKSSSIVGKFTVDTRNLELEIPVLEIGSNNNEVESNNIEVHLKKSSSIAGKHMVDTRNQELGTPAPETGSNNNKVHLKKSSSIVGKHMVNARNLEVGTPALETEYDNNQEYLAKNCSIAGKFKVVTRNIEFETPALETGYDNEQEYLAKSCSSERNVVNNTPEEFANKKDYLKMLTYWKDQGITGKTFRHPDFRGAYDYDYE
ncbi:uncharacterized protein LOC111046706 [Nilaparvata lugens]|uniref:uncharacterized protein LOC111046706 n=1 Tax=Nilaparvata lugens TaxID=108931 RepID=UPI00193D8242|nr:uncharacterized protein LOC111046706 [Nilaparvata lugens]